MDSLQLLNVLDVIKNEEIYTKRLKELQAHQAKLDKSSHIVATVEIAERRLQEAEDQKAKATELVIKLEEDLKRVRSEIQKEYETKYEEVARREKASQVREKDSQLLLRQAAETRDQNEFRSKELKVWEEIVTEIEKRGRDLETRYSSKFDRIKQIIEE